jgi:hypothetical protein
VTVPSSSLTTISVANDDIIEACFQAQAFRLSSDVESESLTIEEALVTSRDLGGLRTASTADFWIQTRVPWSVAIVKKI